MFWKVWRSITPEIPHHLGGRMSALHLLTFAPDQLIQSRNFELQIEAFDAGETAFDVAGEQLGIFGSELFIGQCCYGRAVAIDD